jgi:hypothetical protein
MLKGSVGKPPWLNQIMFRKEGKYPMAKGDTQGKG